MKNSTRHANAIDPVKNSLNHSPWRRGLPRKQQLPLTQTIGIIRGFLLIPLAIACFTLAPQARADCQQGCITNYGTTFFGESALYWDLGFNNTAFGDDALANNYEGNNNTATGYFALFGDPNNFSYGSDNTATGAYALYSYTTGSNNTATGVNSLFSNMTGSDNTAIGVAALSSNTDGNNNVAIGSGSLVSNTEGSDNTATGLNSLFSNDSGTYNTADGSAALATNTTGIGNTATGQAALNMNNGSYNTADGFQALLSNTTGNNNTACGLNALFSNTTGSNNIGLGSGAGGALTTGSDNIDIGHAGSAYDAAKIRIGTKGTHKNTYVAGIYGVTVARGTGVIVDSSGHLGTTTSSARFKEAIEPMERASEAILALEPVTFRYKQELDPDQIPQFGLVAEQVAKVNPDLVARDEEGKPYTVRYEAVNAMLLNEFLKEHRKGEEQDRKIAEQNRHGQEQEAAITQLKCTVAKQQGAIAQHQKSFGLTIADQQKQIETLTSTLHEQALQIQKVSAQLGVTKAASHMVFNNW